MDHTALLVLRFSSKDSWGCNRDKETFKGGLLESGLPDSTQRWDKEAQGWMTRPLSWWKVLDLCRQPRQIQVGSVDLPFLVQCVPSAEGSHLSWFHYTHAHLVVPNHLITSFAANGLPSISAKVYSPELTPRHDTQWPKPATGAERLQVTRLTSFWPSVWGHGQLNTWYEIQHMMGNITTSEVTEPSDDKWTLYMMAVETGRRWHAAERQWPAQRRCSAGRTHRAWWYWESTHCSASSRFQTIVTSVALAVAHLHPKRGRERA